MLDKNQEIASIFEKIHLSLQKQFLLNESKKNLIKDSWTKKGLGEGTSVVIDGGEFFDKAGINFSKISGDSLPQASLGKENFHDVPYFATGVSVVFHPKNPNVPTAHLNIRYFCTFKGDEILDEWFGGGFDLTPYVLFEEDCRLWHQEAKNACDFNYEAWKKNCDSYFFLKHRKEHRGIGGIFYENQRFDKRSSGLKLSQDVVTAFLNAYTKIIKKRKNLPHTDRQKEFQRFRRGRYVEFNLIYDRGTLFGLQSGGRIESILMSLPNEVSWRYKFDNNLNEEEIFLYSAITKARNWI